MCTVIPVHLVQENYVKNVHKHIFIYVHLVIFKNGTYTGMTFFLTLFFPKHIIDNVQSIPVHIVIFIDFKCTGMTCALE